jgi:hypothetical protein
MNIAITARLPRGIPASGPQPRRLAISGTFRADALPCLDQMYPAAPAPAPR